MPLNYLMKISVESKTISLLPPWSENVGKRLTKMRGAISAITYNPTFEQTLRKMTEWVKSSVTSRAVIYTGEMENTSGEIKLLNFRNMAYSF